MSSSDTPNTDLWLERSRLDGMLLGGVSYGMFTILTLQAFSSLWRRRKLERRQPKNTRPAHTDAFLAYIVLTFVLATIGLAGNAKYTEMIWVDLRDAPGGPALLIELELDYWINRMALASYYIMEWMMGAMLLYRCFIIWRWHMGVIALMTTLYLASVAMAITVLTESKGAVFYNINVQLAYLCISVGTTIVYTILVVARLLALRREIVAVMGREHARVYTGVAAMVVESAALYSVLGVIFIVAFAVHSDVSNLIFLAISNVQGIAQLLIILRVADGRAFTEDVTKPGPRTLTSMQFGTPGTDTAGSRTRAGEDEEQAGAEDKSCPESHTTKVTHRAGTGSETVGEQSTSDKET